MTLICRLPFGGTPILLYHLIVPYLFLYAPRIGGSPDIDGWPHCIHETINHDLSPERLHHSLHHYMLHISVIGEYHPSSLCSHWQYHVIS